MTSKIQAGSAMPELSLPAVGGGEVKIGGGGRWQAVVVYRGKHCPICRKYLGRLNEIIGKFEDIGVEVVAVSGDPKEKAETTVSEWSVKVPVGYGLSIEEMRKLVLYVSNPRSEQETDRPFPEPGLFVINPEGKVQIVDISNAPFSRPDLESVAGGIAFIKEKGYPIRGTA